VDTGGPGPETNMGLVLAMNGVTGTVSADVERAEADQKNGGHFGCQQGNHGQHRPPEVEDWH